MGKRGEKPPDRFERSATTSNDASAGPSDPDKPNPPLRLPQNPTGDAAMPGSVGGVPRDSLAPSGPDDTLIQTFDRLRDELVSTLAYVLGNRDDAQDAAQDAFLKCWRAKGTIADVLNLRAWIFRVGLNTARDYQRSGWNKRAKPLIAEDVLLPSRDVPPAERVEEEETILRLRKALLDLRQDEREVFLLRQNGELTYEQIAEIRETPVGTVKTQMRTALIKLRKVLNPGDTHSPDTE